MRILVITNQIPYPTVSGAPLRTYNILRRLASEHDVYLVAFEADKMPTEGVAHLSQFCRQVIAIQTRPLKDALHWGKALRAIMNAEPPELRLGYSEELASEIRRLSDRVDFDLVQIEHGSMGMYLDSLPPRLREKTIWLLHDIDFDKFARIARIEPRKLAKVRYGLHAAIMKRWQPRMADRFRLCVTMSEADRRLLLSYNGNLEVFVSPNGVDTKSQRQLLEEADDAEILFVGNMSYQPNVDAAIYFCGEVLPLIRKLQPDLKVWIVGIKPDESVKRLEGDGVFVTGQVKDVVPYYRRSKVCVVPLRAGSGTRLKILEAMALGRPVVSTSIGCEGLDVENGRHLLIANDSESFARHVVKLLAEPRLRAGIAASAREFVVASYDWEVIARKYIDDIENVLKAGRER